MEIIEIDRIAGVLMPLLPEGARYEWVFRCLMLHLLMDAAKWEWRQRQWNCCNAAAVAPVNFCRAELLAISYDGDRWYCTISWSLAKLLEYLSRDRERNCLSIDLMSIDSIVIASPITTLDNTVRWNRSRYCACSVRTMEIDTRRNWIGRRHLFVIVGVANSRNTVSLFLSYWLNAIPFFLFLWLI